MANTVTHGIGSVRVSAMDSDYLMASSASLGTSDTGMYITEIQFTPSAANDKIVIRSTNATGTALMVQTDITGGGLVVYPGGIFKPFIDFSECTFSSASSAEVTIKYKYSVGQR